MSSLLVGYNLHNFYIYKFMKPGNKNSFKSLKSIKINNKDYKYFSLKKLKKMV